MTPSCFTSDLILPFALLCGLLQHILASGYLHFAWNALPPCVHVVQSFKLPLGFLNIFNETFLDVPFLTSSLHWSMYFYYHMACHMICSFIWFIMFATLGQKLHKSRHFSILFTANPQCLKQHLAFSTLFIINAFGLFLHLILCTLFAFLINLFSCLFLTLKFCFHFFPSHSEDILTYILYFCCYSG